MRYFYCPRCGGKLTQRLLGDEGDVPYCANCHRPWFDAFSTCILAAVVRDRQVALLRQGEAHWGLVSGYVKPGERAEDAALREIQEELGLTARNPMLVGTYPFAQRDLLMVGLIAETDGAGFRLSSEVEAARWVPVRQALGMVYPPPSSAFSVLQACMERLERQRP